MKKFLLLLIALLLIGGGFYSYRHFGVKSEKPLTVKVTRNSLVQKAEAVGYIQPAHSTIVKSPINGVVEELYQREGDLVNKDQSLAKINPSPSPSDYAAIYKAFADSKTQELEAQKDVLRYEQAFKKGLITSNYVDYTAARKLYESTQWNRILAAQQLALIEKGQTKIAGKTIANIIKSPTAGYILYRFVDIGDPVLSLSSAQASTPLFAISNLNDLMFVGVIDEIEASKVSIGMPATITIGALPDQVITGTVNTIALQSEKENISIGGKATITDSPFNVGFKIEITQLKFPDHLTLRSGYSATAEINTKTLKNVLLLPVRTIHFDPDEKTYVLLPPSDHEKSPKKQSVKTGASDNINIEITQGLKEGDEVLDQVSETNGGNNGD